MNTKQVLIALAVAAAMSATAAMAQDAPAPAAPAATAPAAQGGGHKGRHEMKFEDRKAKTLERLSKAAAKIQEKQACAQASTNKEYLQACFPKRGEVKGKHHKHGGDDAATGGASAPAAAPAPAGK